MRISRASPLPPSGERSKAVMMMVIVRFAKLKDLRRISMRYDRCACTFFSAICIAATVIFWRSQ
jgi:hypothetical protein